MAKKIPDEMIDHIVKATPRSDYNWERYADGSWWELRRKEDYTVQTATARQAAIKWGRKEGYRVETGNLKEGDGFALRFK
jgi:hypothetical protein